MIFTAKSTDLQQVLAKIGGVVPTKSPLPILETILFDLINDTLTLTATDSDISLTISLEVKGKEDGSIAIPAKRLTDTIRALPDTDVTFSIDTTKNKIIVNTSNGEYIITGESAKEFPSVSPFEMKEKIAIESIILRKIVHRTVFAVSTDELRPAMMGVLLQPKQTDLRAVSTDGHRLVQFTQKLSADTMIKHDIIVPSKALNLLNKSLDGSKTNVSMSDTHIQIDFESTVLTSRLIDETYPNYESVIPTENDKELVINRENLISSIRRVALYASATTHQVRFQLAHNSVQISAQDVDFGGEARETIECEYQQDELEIGFNSTYVIDVLSHLESEKVSFKFSSPTRAAIVSPLPSKQDEDIIMLVMPVRLNN